MICVHISRAKRKINSLIDKFNNCDPTVCKKMGPYLEWKQITIFRRIEYERAVAALAVGGEQVYINAVNSNGFDNALSEIFDELENCKCLGEVADAYKELEGKYITKIEFAKEFKGSVDKLTGEKCNLEKERNDWKTKYSDKNRENENNKERLETEKRGRQNDNTQHNNDKLKWEREKGELQTESARKDEQNIALRNQLQEKDNQIGRLEIKVDEKTLKIQGLADQLANLRIESNNKDNELRQKNEEIERLKKWAELSQEELLKEKIRSEREHLDFFATELGVDLEKTHSLSKYHERLFQANKTHNQANIDTHEVNIARAKQELLEKKKVSIVNVQEICRKCERIAELRWELEQIKQKQTQMNEWKNINSNFTPELVQEWINHNFAIEQCQEWINILSPWQQNRAIKEPAYYAWLRDIKKVDAEWVLNHGNEQELGKEFFQWCQEQQQFEARQEVPINH